MTQPAPDIILDVDLRNPGQFFACCGVLELASRLWPGSEGWFDREESRIAFHVATYSGHNDPLGEIVRRLCDSGEIVALAEDHEVQAQADRKPVVIVPFELRLDWWLDSYRGGDKSELKVWAGQVTPQRNLTALWEAWCNINADKPDEIGSRRLLSRRWPETGMGFDPASSWKSIDVGFSPDEQQVNVLTSPAAEILAAIGLQRCRPWYDEKKRGRWFVYRAWADPLEIAVVPAALMGAGRALSTHTFPVVMRNAQYGNFGWSNSWEAET